MASKWLLVAAGIVPWAAWSSEPIQRSESAHVEPRNEARPLPNLVLTPDFAATPVQEETDVLIPQEKLQYAPACDGDLPILVERSENEAVAGGAKYEAGSDIYIDPKTDFEVSSRPVREDDEMPEVPAALRADPKPETNAARPEEAHL